MSLVVRFIHSLICELWGILCHRTNQDPLETRIGVVTVIIYVTSAWLGGFTYNVINFSLYLAMSCK